MRKGKVKSHLKQKCEQNKKLINDIRERIKSVIETKEET